MHSTRPSLALLSALTLALAPSLAHAAPAPASAPAPAHPLDSLRERFRAGHDKYKSGAFAEAIVIWESIYRDLGPEKGYRLAFDIARAYDELSELIKAAEHYETYLEQVAARRREGELLEPQVEKQEVDARERLEKIAAQKARVRVNAGDRPILARVDSAPPRVAGFTLFVEPGDHTVTFGEGAASDVRKLSLRQGELLEVDPPKAPELPPSPPATRWESRTEHPFSPTVIWVGAGVAVVSLVIPAVFYANALSVKSDYDDTATTRSDKERLATDYSSARTNAYASIIVPAVFTAATGGIALWYVLGTRETRVPITPSPSIGPTGASLDLTGRF